jgi:hypothetical protein
MFPRSAMTPPPFRPPFRPLARAQQALEDGPQMECRRLRARARARAVRARQDLAGMCMRACMRTQPYRSVAQHRPAVYASVCVCVRVRAACVHRKSFMRSVHGPRPARSPHPGLGDGAAAAGPGGALEGHHRELGPQVLRPPSHHLRPPAPTPTGRPAQETISSPRGSPAAAGIVERHQGRLLREQVGAGGRGEGEGKGPKGEASGREYKEERAGRKAQGYHLLRESFPQLRRGPA